MKPDEVTHFSLLIADLMVAAARATSVEQLSAVRAELGEALADVLSLLAHDAPPSATVLSLRPDWATDPRQWSVRA